MLVRTLHVKGPETRHHGCSIEFARLTSFRLKQSLSLPKIQPRPPCPPKIYQKLYRFLDGALPTGARRSARPPRKIENASRVAETPTKHATPAKEAYRRPTSSRTKIAQGLERVSQTPAWVMPMIRKLCKKLGAPSAPHHIFAGVSSILGEQGVDGTRSVKTPALTIALLFLVTTRLAGVPTTPHEYTRQKELALDVLGDLSGDVDWETVTSEDVDCCMRQFRDEPWKEMDWFRNIQPGFGTADEEGEDQGASSSEDAAAEGQLLPVKRHWGSKSDSADSNYLQAGLGTMMHDGVDYLSDERRRDYQIWKADMLQRTAEVGSEEGWQIEADEMDTDGG